MTINSEMVENIYFPLNQWIEINKMSELKSQITCHVKQFVQKEDIESLVRLIFISTRDRENSL